LSGRGFLIGWILYAAAKDKPSARTAPSWAAWLVALSAFYFRESYRADTLRPLSPSFGTIHSTVWRIGKIPAGAARNRWIGVGVPFSSMQHWGIDAAISNHTAEWGVAARDGYGATQVQHDDQLALAGMKPSFSRPA
jgi:hypothetical protein